MRVTLRTIILLSAAFLLLSCSCTRKSGGTTNPEFFSGSFVIDRSGKASFTDCATRITMDIESEGRYEELRREYAASTAEPGEPVRIEFFGSILRHRPIAASENLSPDAPRYPMTDIEVRVDSLASLATEAACITDYIVAGMYRRVQDGPAEILRLRPDYTYTIENFTTADGKPLQEGRWYRTSEMTLELKEGQTATVVEFQIIPVRESLAGNGDSGPVAYKKEWL